MGFSNFRNSIPVEGWVLVWKNSKFNIASPFTIQSWCDWNHKASKHMAKPGITVQGWNTVLWLSRYGQNFINEGCGCLVVFDMLCPYILFNSAFFSLIEITVFPLSYCSFTIHHFQLRGLLNAVLIISSTLPLFFLLVFPSIVIYIYIHVAIH